MDGCTRYILVPLERTFLQKLELSLGKKMLNFSPKGFFLVFMFGREPYPVPLRGDHQLSAQGDRVLLGLKGSLQPAKSELNLFGITLDFCGPSFQERL